MAKKRKLQLERLVSDTNLVLDEISGDAGLPDRLARKARRTSSATTRHSEREFESTDSDSSSDDEQTRPAVRQRQVSGVKSGQLAFPRSAYEGYQPPLPTTSEFDALSEFKSILHKQRIQSSEPSDYDFVILEDFSAYRSPREARRPYELAGLETLQVHRGTTDGLLFDGILRLGETRRYVQGIPINTTTVEGYGDPSVADLGNLICMQSPLACRSGIWYQLGQPSQEYQRFFKPFVWLAEFTKHFVDYLLEMSSVTLEDFRFCFYDWLSARHADDGHFRVWLSSCNLRDFRTTVAANVPYLWNECWGVESEETRLLQQPMWKEVDPFNLTAIPEQPNRETKTVVTPFAHNMFKHMYFNEHLNERDVACKQTMRKIRQTKSKLDLTPFGVKEAYNTALMTPKTHRSNSPMESSGISEGDVVCLDADNEGDWKVSSSTWYAYVQAVRPAESGERTVLDLLWLYEPHDTTFGAAYYPYENELFLSDNCACGQEGIDAQHVKGKVAVSWFAKDPNVEAGLFVRQKFRTAHDEGTDDFVTLQESDFRCRCGSRLTDFEDCRYTYDIGDTVLVKSSRRQHREARLDVAQIVDFDLQAEQVVLRHLQRQRDTDGEAAPNELRWTDVTSTTSPKHIIRQCHVGFFTQEVVTTGLPTGYDRGGAGDFYYIVEPGTESSSKTDYSTFPPITEELDLVTPPPFEKLTGLGIFCGGGNLDRGLEDSGAVDFKYAVDWAKGAMHTYRANSREPDKVQCFLGSVNDYLALAMNGSKARFIALPGGIGLLAAGSPCPGFSSLQPDKASDQSKRNASMVASVVSYVDIFCPQYCILENVVTMTAGMGKDKDQNVFAQIMAAFVAMGYQTRPILMDAWSHGSSQQRSRVFIVASAPGLEPFPLPALTHDHPRAHFTLRALGKSSNGRSFGVRRDEYTPFPAVTASEATADLPDIADGQVRTCPAFPDHHPPSEESADSRERMACIPTQPPGMGLADAVRQGLVAGKPVEYLRNCSSVKQGMATRLYSRVWSSRLFPTITTALRIACGITGRTLHWEQHRSLTVMELRRAMGFLDSDVIVGTGGQQVKIIGNSVDRKVSFALGLCLRESWAKSNASRLPALPVALEGAMVTPSPIETDFADEQSEGDARRGFAAISDTLRAGASAPAGLEVSEREALQVVDPSMVSPPRMAGRAPSRAVIGLTADSDDGSDVGGAPGGEMEEARYEQRLFAGRPTAYVKVTRGS